MARSTNDRDRDEVGASGDNAELVGGAAGGAAGAAGGAAIGAIAGPVGAIIGALAGAGGGWWAGKEIVESGADFSTADDEYYRSRFERTSGVGGMGGARGQSYDQVRPLYQFGHIASRNPAYQGRAFGDVEPELQRAWTPELSRQYGDWSTARHHVNEAFTRANEARVTRSEEELAIGKRQVQAGEVAVHKTVETEHVSERVPVMREEVSVERRPVNADASGVEIGEETIRVPLMEEEVIVDKRPVVKEEIVLRTRAVEETEEVEADLRRERVDIDERGRTSRDDRRDDLGAR